MASLHLDRPWLSLHSDPSNGIGMLHRNEIPQRRVSIPGSIVLLANGRRRAIAVRSSSFREVSLSVALNDEREKNLLVSWMGSTMLFRDGFGQSYPCVTFNIAWTGGRQWEADFDVQEVTL